MTSYKLLITDHLEKELKRLTDLLLDCTGYPETCVLVADAAKSIREAYRQMRSRRVCLPANDGIGQQARSAQEAAEDRLDEAVVLSGWDRPASNTESKVFSFRDYATDLSDTDTAASSSPGDRKRSASSCSSFDGGSGERGKKRLREHKSRNDDDVKELLDKACTDSLDGFCVVDGCDGRVSVRGFCRRDYSAFRRAVRTEQNN